MRNAYRILVRKPEEKRLLGKLGHGWEDNIRIAFKERDGKVWTGCIWLRIRTSGRLM
jgi:hypothetical protein